MILKKCAPLRKSNVNNFCGQMKEIDQFPNGKNQCQDCLLQYQEEYRNNEINKQKRNEYNKIYREENKDIILETNKLYYANNREEKLIYATTYRITHKEEIVNNRKSRKENKKEYDKKYALENKEKIRLRNNQWASNKRTNDPIFKLRAYISNAINYGLKSNNSNKNDLSISDFLPYTINDLKLYLESLFESWMKWENHGKYNAKNWNDNDSSTWTWQLDHIIPHSTFKYSTMDCQEFRDCWALSNLRPLSAKQNWIDGSSKIRHRSTV